MNLTLLSLIFSILHSKNHLSFPFSNGSLHHLSPTNNLPVTFLVAQKSIALKIKMPIYVVILADKK